MKEKHERTMKLAQQGHSHLGIAKRLDVTPQTAKKYMQHVRDVRGPEALMP